MDDSELDAMVRHLATIRIETREHLIAGDGAAHVMSTEFDELDTPIPVLHVLSSDPMHYPGCTILSGGVRHQGLVAPPARFVPEDMQIVLKDGTDKRYFEGTVPALIELEESRSVLEPEPPVPNGDSSAEGTLDRAAARETRRATRQAARRAARQDRRTRLGRPGAWIRLKGRGFRKFGKIELPSAPPLNLRLTDDVDAEIGTLEGGLSDPVSIALVWDPADIANETNVLIELELTRFDPAMDENDTLRMFCFVPDDGAFETPEDLRNSVDLSGYSATRLEVSRRTEESIRLDESLVRIVRRSLHVVEKD